MPVVLVQITQVTYPLPALWDQKWSGTESTPSEQV